MDEGNCYDNILSYYYNSERSACEQFYYTGCGGNANRFETREHCERQCAEFKAVGKYKLIQFWVNFII